MFSTSFQEMHEGKFEGCFSKTCRVLEPDCLAVRRLLLSCFTCTRLNPCIQQKSRCSQLLLSFNQNSAQQSRSNPGPTSLLPVQFLPPRAVLMEHHRPRFLLTQKSSDHSLEHCCEESVEGARAKDLLATSEPSMDGEE